MNLADRHLELLREQLQLPGRQVAELVLNGPQFVEQAQEYPVRAS
jgi:hypothetical protein